MIQDEVSEILLDGTHKDRLFKLPGAYRHLLTSAKNVRVVYDNEWCAVDDVDSISGAPIDTTGAADGETDGRMETIPGTPLATTSDSRVEIASNIGAINTIRGVGEFPFVERVEEMWNNGELPLLLADAGMEFIKAGKIPSSSPSSRAEKGGEGDDEGSIVRVSFSLCASTYATTYLEHLRDVINNNTPEP